MVVTVRGRRGTRLGPTEEERKKSSHRHRDRGEKERGEGEKWRGEGEEGRGGEREIILTLLRTLICFFVFFFCKSVSMT